MMDKVFLVTGSLGYPAIEEVMAWAGSLPRESLLICGMGGGVDAVAASSYARSLRELGAGGQEAADRLVVFPLERSREGLAAAPLRNARMVRAALDLRAVGHEVQVVAFWDGAAPETKDCIDRAVAAGLEVDVRQGTPTAAESPAAPTEE